MYVLYIYISRSKTIVSQLKEKFGLCRHASNGLLFISCCTIRILSKVYLKLYIRCYRNFSCCTIFSLNFFIGVLKFYSFYLVQSLKLCISSLNQVSKELLKLEFAAHFCLVYLQPSQDQSSHATITITFM